jgi:DNA-binding CsgD family transcriptional regulator
MRFDISPDFKENIYSKHLNEIAGVKFTLREIDVIACIVHNRGEKKIASLLTITYRTVGVHVRNIMNKFGCNSKEYIIDFVEKSGKLQYFRQYYFHLVAELSFVKILQKIAKLINRSAVNCTIDFTTSNNESIDKQLKKIKEYLSWANILITDINAATGNEEINLYVLSEDTIIKKNLPQYDRNKVNGRGIALIFDKDGEDLTLLGNMQYVEFISATDYYFSILELIRKIIGVDDIEKFIQEFKNEYQSLQDSWKGVGVEQITTGVSQKKSKIFFISIILFVSVVIAELFFINRKTTSPDISYINRELATFVKIFSADSITTEEEKKRNYTLVGQVSKIVENFNDKSVQNYFQNGPVTYDEMINCLYVMHALGTHYVYNEHNGIKSRELLKIAKDIAESYVIRRHKSPINFSTLTAEEIYVELSIFKDLPEMYAKIIYLLGKTYMYQGDLQGTEKYYELSKYLGNKSGIFEGYLSTRSGLEMLRHSNIRNDIKNKEYIRAQKNLLESIEVFTAMKKDHRPYKISYRPGSIDPQIIVPAKDVHNLLFIDEEIIKAYSMLITIAEEKQQKQEYADKILGKFIGSKSSPGMLVEVNKVVLRRLSSMYNEFGNILLQLEKENLDFQHCKKEIIKILNLVDGDNLDIILQIFNLAKLNSRNNEYTKADSYNGLAQVKELMLKEASLSIEKKNKLQAEILDHKAKRDEINLRLKRKVPLLP